MYYQRNSRRTDCPCSSANRNQNASVWERRIFNGSACSNAGNTRRNGCGCNNIRTTERTGCGCNNTRTTERNGCGCNNARITERTGCGCGAEGRQTREERQKYPCQNQGTQWKSRGGCLACTESRTVETPCAKGAEDTGLLSGQSLAMVYSPYQHFQEVYDPREGLCNGTIFSDLDKPFCPKCGG